MKFIIDNYSSAHSSQPMQFHRQFQEQGIQSELLDMSSGSVYDIMDSFNPDILITSGTRLTKAMAQYLKEDQKKELVLMKMRMGMRLGTRMGMRMGMGMRMRMRDPFWWVD